MSSHPTAVIPGTRPKSPSTIPLPAPPSCTALTFSEKSAWRFWLAPPPRSPSREGAGLTGWLGLSPLERSERHSLSLPLRGLLDLQTRLSSSHDNGCCHCLERVQMQPCQYSSLEIVRLWSRMDRVLRASSFPEKTEKDPHKKLLLGLTAFWSYLLLHSKGQSLVLLMSHLGLLERNSKKPQGLRNCKDAAKTPKTSSM